MHTRGKPLGRRTSTSSCSRARPPGLTGADLANLCNEAAIFAARGHRDLIAQADFDAALERVVAGMQSRRTLNEHERRVVAYHEAGHALCAELLPGVDRVHKISIVPRGRALGYTLNLPEEDRYLKTREELIDYMTVLLGGRVAEEIVFGAVTTGAVRRPPPRGRDLALDGPRVRDGHLDHLAQGVRRGRRGLGPHAPAARRGAAAPRRRGACAPRMRLIGEHRGKLEQLALRAAAQRGPRARGHRPHHGRRRRASTAAAASGLRVVATPTPRRTSPRRGTPSGRDSRRSSSRSRPLEPILGAMSRASDASPPRRCGAPTTSARCSSPGRSAPSSSRSSG